MKRQQRTVGAILRIDLEDGYYNYAQILEFGVAFFDIHVKEAELESLDILLEKPILFIVEVYNDVITRGRWIKVGKLPIIDFENYARRVIGLPIRPYDLNHSKTIRTNSTK